jgi:hypothetical protein
MGTASARPARERPAVDEPIDPDPAAVGQIDLDHPRPGLEA